MNEKLLLSLREQLADPLLELRSLPAGGNSRVLQVVSPRHGDLVVKSYIADGRRRLETEFAALQFLFAQGLPVPQPHCAVAAENYAVYRRLAGRKVTREEVSNELIAQLLDFLHRLHALGDQEQDFAPAAEACLVPAAVVAIIERRRHRFSAVENGPLQDFLRQHFDPLAAKLRAGFRQRYGVELHRPLPRAELTLSPSDFGFHNALLGGSGQLAFVDFEYFGWDDPAKLMADFLWHPAMELGAELKRAFVDGCLDLYGPACRERWLRSHPLHGLKWALLTLNEFIDADWQRRQFAGEKRQREERLARQLGKASLLLRRIEEDSERNPYVD